MARMAHSVTHDYCVAQRVTYGNTAIIGHYRVQETLGTTQEVIEEELGHAACVGDDSAVPCEVEEHLGGTHRGKKYVTHRQFTQEEVHGSVQPSRGDNRQ